jgi:cytochrome c oxidase cbb3-type subunit III
MNIMIFPDIKTKWIRRIFMVVLSFIIAVPAMAQTATDSTGNLETLLLVVLSFVLIVSILILIIGLYLVSIIKIVLLEDRKQKALADGKEFVPEEEKSWLNKLMTKATDAVPIGKEETILLDHNYDGIQELDNHLPPWWKWLFYITIIWGVIYFFVYHVSGSLPLMHEEYEIVMADAKAAKEAQMALAGNNIDETNVERTTDPAILAKGKVIYDRSCVPCHAPEGQGLIGPNFTDNYWIHGGSINDVFKTIKYGVPQKGMISWQSQLSPSDMSDVANYILSFVGTTPKNPPAPKGPEGIEYKPDAQAPAAETPPAEQPAANS